MAGSAGDPVDACAAERRVAAERCGLAVGARVRATEAADLLRAAQRTYDDHITAADAAAAIADARAVRREKEAAQSRFRAAYNGSKSTEEAEAAARDWLVDINEVNTAARTRPSPRSGRRQRPRRSATRLERLTLEADAARIAAEAVGGRLPRRPPGPRRVRRASRGRLGSTAAARAVERTPDRPDRRGRAAGRGPVGRGHTDHLPAPARRPDLADRPGHEACRRGPDRNAGSGRRVSPSSSRRSSR